MPVFLLQIGTAFLNTAPTDGTDIGTFTRWATDMLTWFISAMTTVVDFMIDNPIVLVGLVMSLIVAAIGMLRHILGAAAKTDPDQKKKKFFRSRK